MSNTMINWRFGAWHLQVLAWRNWSAREARRIVRVSRNPVHARGGSARAEQGWSPVAIYDGAGYFAGLCLLALILVIWTLP